MNQVSKAGVERVGVADRLRELGDDPPLHEFPPGVERLLLDVVTLNEHDVEHEVKNRGARSAVVLERLNDGRPSSASAISSPSMTVSLGSFARPRTTAGYRTLKSLSLRERRCTRPAVLNATAR